VTAAFEWRSGESKLQHALEDVLLATDPAAAGYELTSERAGHRRLGRVRLPGGEILVLKHIFCAGHRRHRRERAKNALGLSTAEREGRALTRLRKAGVAVPVLRALALLPDGDRLLATQHLAGRSLREALSGGGAARRSLLAAVGDLVRRLHASGHVHRDLHAGNILVTADGPVLLDLGAARRSRRRAARRRDVGALDHSLAELLSTADRVRLRAAAAGLLRPFDKAARSELRALGRASMARARGRAASRTRRALFPGRRFARLRFDGCRGLQLRTLERSAVLAALAAHRDAGGGGDWTVLKSDVRSRVTAGPTAAGSMVVKEYPSGGLGRRLADAFRGSPARRAWLGGHGLQARGIAAATPYAFVERRRFGLAVASAAVFEDLRDLASADRCAPPLASAGEVVDTLTQLATKLHRNGVIHGDLKASHVLLGRRGRRLEARLIDLEGVRFPARLRDSQRVRALAELNASLPDRFADAPRCRAFARYAAALPFRRGRAAALRAIVDLSLKRAHRWTGAGCALARNQRLTRTQQKELEEPGTRPPWPSS
jgi:tRNA A-37 threonylcarbamoyl transferase component Bud32